MLDRLDWAEFVLVVCTETYYRRFRGHEKPAIGRGADWEGNLITLEMYGAKSTTTKFAPLLFDGQNERFIPEPLRGHTQYLLNSEENYDKLYAFLVGQAGVSAWELGPVKTLARSPVEPLRFDVSDMSACQLPLSNLPERNLFFTGREDVLAQLQEALAAQSRVALSGLGGVGKTQTAFEYAHRHLEEYTHVFWASADSWEALASGYAAIAGLLKLPEADAAAPNAKDIAELVKSDHPDLRSSAAGALGKLQEQPLVVEAVKRWLGSHQGWLLLLDNADDLGVAREFLPTGKNGHALLTTRARAIGALARLVEVQEMRPEQGALFLLRRAKYVRADALLESAAEADRAGAKAIAMQLGGLPLALDQAGAYLEETGCGLSGYLDLYRSHALELLRRRGGLMSDQPAVATTWALSFEKIEKANAAGAELLKLCAFLHPNAMPEEVFREGAPALGPALVALGSDKFAWNDALFEILKYSLLRRDANASTLEIHRLVQAVLKQGMDEATQRRWAECAVRAVDRAFPKVEFSTWALCDRFLAQALTCAGLINQWGFEFPEGARLLNHAGSYLHERGRYTEAERLFERALGDPRKGAGPRAPRRGREPQRPGRALPSPRGHYAKAEPLYQRALAIREKALGTDHPDVAASLNNLALLYYHQGRYAQAEPLYQRALAIREKALGPDHPDVATGLNNQAALYYVQGRYAQAEPLFERALAIWEKALGPDHPNVATSLNTLGSALPPPRPLRTGRAAL